MEDGFGREDLLKFLSFLADKALANNNTVQGLKVAVTKILTDLSPEEEADVRRVNVDLAIRRFHNRNPGALSPASLGIYERRVKSAIEEFASYKASPTSYTGYKGGGKLPSQRQDKSKEMPKSSRPTRTNGVNDSVGDTGVARTVQPPASGLVHSFPLRTDFLAQIVLPHDLKGIEARRLSAFISALAVDFGES